MRGTAGQQEKGKFLLLPPASKANWQLFVISAGRIPSVGLNNNLRVGFNSILFKSYCTLLNCFCFVVNETKSSLCKGKIVEQQSWNLHVKSFLFYCFHCLPIPHLVWFCSVLQSCCALQVTSLAWLCPARASLGKTPLDHAQEGSAWAGPALLTRAWGRASLSQPSSSLGTSASCQKGPCLRIFAKDTKIPRFSPFFPWISSSSHSNQRSGKQGLSQTMQPWHFLGVFFLFFFFPVIFFSES